MIRYSERAQRLIQYALDNFAGALTFREQYILARSADPSFISGPGLNWPNAAIDAELLDLAGEHRIDIPRDCPTTETPLRAGFIRWLVTDPGVAALVDHHGFLIEDMEFSTGLDLSDCHISRPIIFKECKFQSRVFENPSVLNVNNAELPGLAIVSSCIDRIDADYIRVNGSLEVLGSCVGHVGLVACGLGGELTFQKVDFNGTTNAVSKSDVSLRIARARIGGHLNLVGVTADREVQVLVSELGGVFIRGCKLNNAGSSMKIASCNIAGALGIYPLTEAHKELIGKIQWPQGCREPAATTFPEVDFTRTDLGKAGGLNARGRVSFAGTRVQEGLYLDSILIKGESLGETDPGLGRDGSSIALDLGMMEVSGPTSLINFRSAASSVIESAIRAVGASFEGKFLCKDWVFDEVLSFDFTSCTFKQAVVFISVQAKLALIDLSLSTINESIDFTNCEIASLKAERMRSSSLHLDNTTSIMQLVLRDADIGIIEDEPDHWPTRGNLYAAGLRVREFPDLTTRPSRSVAELGAEQKQSRKELERVKKDLAGRRIEWLKLQPLEDRLAPGAWLSLSRIFEALGRTSDAKRVRFELRRLQAQASPNWLFRPDKIVLAWVQRELFLVVPSILLFFLAGTATFWHLRAHFSETTSDAYRFQNLAGQPMTGAYPKFNPALYALENTLPIVKLGQDAKWAPDPRKDDKDEGNGGRRKLSAYRLLNLTRALLILIGWIHGLILGYAVAEKFKS